MMLDRFFAGDPANILGSLSLTRHFQSFSNGLIDTADIAYFILFAVTFLTLTVRRLDADRLRG
jgi:ABC-2 type transport system permease protein